MLENYIIIKRIEFYDEDKDETLNAIIAKNLNDKYVIIDETGTILLNFEFDLIECVNQSNTLLASINGKFGLIDNALNYAIECKYSKEEIKYVSSLLLAKPLSKQQIDLLSNDDIYEYVTNNQKELMSNLTVYTEEDFDKRDKLIDIINNNIMLLTNFNISRKQ